MWTAWGKRKLRLYQDLALPTTAATVTRVPRRLIARMRSEPTELLPSGGTNGGAIVSPFWVTVKGYVSSVDATPQLLTWVVFLNCAAALAAIFFVIHGESVPSWWKIAALAIVAGIAERQAVRVTKNVEMTVSFLPFVFTAVAFGPFAAFLVGAAANLAILRPPYLQWAVYAPARAISGGLTGSAAVMVAPTNHRGFAGIVLATTVAGAVNFVTDAVVNVTTLVLRRSASPRSFLSAAGPFFALSMPLYVPVVALMVYGNRNYSFWMAATFLVPALALQRLIHLYQEQREATVALADANHRLEQASLSFAAGLVATLDARDRYTAGHSAAVAVYARDIATRLGLEETEQRLAHLAGLVHDIGKVGLPAGLLEKAGPLTLEERRQMEQHSVIGERILAKIEDYAEIATIVRHHHERVDGTGYPDGLADDEIPLLSRIIAVADAYNAMTSHRPYRDAMPVAVARLRLAQAVESQFDTTVVAAFEAVLAGGTDAYRQGSHGNFAVDAQHRPHLISVVATA
jgi:putative nucleotidyltransferase with HDIG domain